MRSVVDRPSDGAERSQTHSVTACMSLTKLTKQPGAPTSPPVRQFGRGNPPNFIPPKAGARPSSRVREGWPLSPRPRGALPVHTQERSLYSDLIKAQKGLFAALGAAIVNNI